MLIRGEKGTAKSTAVRGLAAVLARLRESGGTTNGSFGRLVELPIGATEDRVIGSLDLQRVLRDGEHAFTPGLLAEAHGGVLYVDEVNLLHDHLVDVLLDAAAMGRVHIERDGVSHSHEARFMLVGTMNPEEGELRPQLLDRFGLTVDVRASRDVDERAEVIRQRMAFEADPAAFARRYAERDAALAQRIAAARARRSAMCCCPTESCGGSRRCARRSASTGCGPTWWWRARRWRMPPGAARRCVDEEDIRVAAQLALPHRRRRDPFDDPGLDPQTLDEALARATDEGEPEPEPDPPGGGVSNTEALQGGTTAVASAVAGQRPSGRAVSHPTAHRAGPRRRCAGAPLACPQPVGRDGAPRMPLRASGCTCSARCWPRPAACIRRGRLGWSPTTCAARSAKGAKPIW